MTANTWLPPTPPGPPAMGWMTGSGNITYLKTNDPSGGGALFNTAKSFCTGISVTGNPVPSPYKTTPVLNLSSYTNSSTATSGGQPNPGLVGDGTTGSGGGLLPKGAITGPYKWIAYDNEVQPSTPVAESNDPVTYMQRFITACRSNGYNVICAPAYGLYTPAALAIHPLNPSTETREHWFVRVIVGLGAAGCDLFVLQQESLADTATYQTVWNDTAAMMAATTPNALVFGEVSSSQGVTGGTAQALGADMAANAKMLTSPYPDGFYVAMPTVPTEMPAGEHQAAGMYFLQDMIAAGYTA